MNNDWMRNGAMTFGLALGLTAALASCGTADSGADQGADNAATPVQPTTNRAEDVDVAKFSELLATLDNPILLDVRSDGEWAEGHLPNASYIPFQSPDFTQQLAALDKNRPVLVYCASGGRSARAMNALNQAGQTEVYNLLGGIRAWSSAGEPVVHGDPTPIQP